MDENSVDFYWRPGCPFCMGLEDGLNNKGVTLVKYNIWDDEEAAATVRAAANGNETVPTVKVGETFLVNPSVKQVVKLLGGDEPKSGGLFSKFKD